MTVYFMDSSAIGKHYMRETGSIWITSLVVPAAGHIIVVSELAMVEVSSALARKQHLAQISAADAAQNRADFLLHLEKVYLAIPLNVAILRQASDLVGRYRLRSLDAVQLACALAGLTILRAPLTFVCADINLLHAATAEGFVTDNPLAHP